MANWPPPDTSRELFAAAQRAARAIAPELWEDENPVLTVSLCHSYTEASSRREQPWWRRLLSRF